MSSAKRTGYHLCLTCYNSVGGADKLEAKDMNDELLGIMQQKGHDVTVEILPGGTQAKPKMLLVFNGSNYEDPNKQSAHRAGSRTRSGCQTSGRRQRRSSRGRW